MPPQTPHQVGRPHLADRFWFMLSLLLHLIITGHLGFIDKWPIKSSAPPINSFDIYTDLLHRGLMFLYIATISRLLQTVRRWLANWIRSRATSKYWAHKYWFKEAVWLYHRKCNNKTITNRIRLHDMVSTVSFTNKLVSNVKWSKLFCMLNLSFHQVYR